MDKPVGVWDSGDSVLKLTDRGTFVWTATRSSFAAFRGADRGTYWVGGKKLHLSYETHVNQTWTINELTQKTMTLSSSRLGISKIRFTRKR